MEVATMKNLKHLIPMSHKVTIYVPGTNGIYAEANNAEYAEKAATLLSSLYGGATQNENVGYWDSEAGILVKEKIITVFSFAAELTEESLDAVVTFCENMKSELKQEAISLEIDGELYFI